MIHMIWIATKYPPDLGSDHLKRLPLSNRQSLPAFLLSPHTFHRLRYSGVRHPISVRLLALSQYFINAVIAHLTELVPPTIAAIMRSTSSISLVRSSALGFYPTAAAYFLLLLIFDRAQSLRPSPIEVGVTCTCLEYPALGP